MSIKGMLKQAVKQAAKEIIQVNLKENLFAIPGLIATQKKVVANLRDVVADAALARDQEEAILMSLIAGEINPQNGKPLYSNKEARDAELITRKKSTPAYLAAESAYKEAEKNLNNAIIELEQLQDEFKALRIIARITCKELALLGLDDEEEDDNDLY